LVAFISHSRRSIIVLIVGLLLIAAAIVFVWLQMAPQEHIDWNVTIVGSSGDEVTVSYDEIKALACYEGIGGFFTSVGYINGPYQLKGVPVVELCDLVGGITQQDIVFISASDGYSTVLDYKQVMGDFITYDPATMREVAHGQLKLILMYELDGRMLSQEEGKPLRLAIAGEDSLLTEGLYWVKWVERVEVIPKDNKDTAES
jgi:DMSO/TMAO reductase YedYZ molybdopterin-dependent catalytic subunit